MSDIGSQSSQDDLSEGAMQRVGFIRNVPIFAGLSDELLQRLAGQVREVRVQAGEWIMRAGETADSLFIVCSGRFEVIDEGPPESLRRVLRRGEIMGELALLLEGTRTASVRARCDAELLELGRDGFEALIQEAPSFALGLTRALGAQLAATRMPVIAPMLPQAIAVVALDAGAPSAEVAEWLADALGVHGSVARLSAGELAGINQAERDVDRVVLQCHDAPPAEWTELCLREADLVVAVSSDAAPEASQLRTTALRGCELLIFGPSVAGGLIEALQPREVQVVARRAEGRGAIEAMARRLTGHSIGVVLSGGGARALAHLGVLQELHAAGLRFDRVGGVSLGSIAAALVAAGLTPDEMLASFERNFMERNPSNDYVLPAYSLVRGIKTRRLLHAELGDRRIEELPLRFFCVSCDLIGRKAVVHRLGRLVDAVYASLAIPGVFPPVATKDGKLLVDGGVLDNLPVETMASKGEGPVIAVDVTGRMGGMSRAGRPALGRAVRRVLTGGDARIPNLGETIIRTLTVGSVDTVAAARKHADLVIAPEVDGIGLMDWKALPRAVELGRRAARDALAAHPEVLSRLAI
jgi:predicted acylesterase/phospholipase RssA